MPGLDKTGPIGQGSRTGRKRGVCAGNTIETPERGIAGGRGFGRGLGRRFKSEGRGNPGRNAGRGFGRRNK